MTEDQKKLANSALATLRLAMRKFLRIDGGQRAAAFAYSAFFALFPLMLLLVTLTSFIFDRANAGAVVVSYAEKYIPISGDIQVHVFNTILRIAGARGRTSLTAFVMLIWAATQFFTTIIHATNRAWGLEGHSWWRRPLKSFTLLGIMVGGVLSGMAMGVLGKMARGIFHANVFFPWAYSVWAYFVPWLALFLGLALFYMLAPRRRSTFREIWPAALFATLLLYVAQTIFVFYLKHSHSLNAFYGGFGGVIALMLWIYVSGAIFIFCACLCAAMHEAKTAVIGTA
jgi:Ca2+-transporting ATPase